MNKDYYLLQGSILGLDEQFTIVKLRKLVDGKMLDDESITFKEFADKLITQILDSKRTVRQVQDDQFFCLSGRSL